jgi:predicted kinase
MIDLVLIRGLPGSGKTTLAHKLLNDSKHTIFHAEADSFFTSVNDTDDGLEYKFDRRLLGAAHDWCYGTAMRELRGGTPVIVSNPFTTQRELSRYIDGVKRSGLPVRVHVVKCTDQYESIHGVPATAIKRMKERWEDFPGEVEYRV